MGISKKRVEAISSIQDENIDYSEIPESSDRFWSRVALQMPQPKKGIYVRLDQDLLEWLKSKGNGYQTRMNAILRALMESDRSAR